jgi:hypothetical protein
MQMCHTFANDVFIATVGKALWQDMANACRIGVAMAIVGQAQAGCGDRTIARLCKWLR